VTKLTRTTLSALLSFASPAAAQRYRVLVADEGSTHVSVVEFRPCVPAETSDCGAWLVEGAVAVSDSSRPSRERLPRVVSRRARATIAISGSSVVVTPTTPGERPATVSGTHGTPLSLAVSGDGAYVFGIFAGAAGQPPELEMIDLNTCSVWAIFPLTARPAAVAMAP
jgi:hypothetical protein